VSAIVTAILPVFLLIVIGQTMKRSGFPGDDIWPSLERLVYFVLFPALLTANLAEVDLEGFRVLPLAGAIMGALGVMGLLIVAMGRRFADGPALTSVFQCTVRFNSYVGLAIAYELWGAAGFALGTVVVAIMVPTTNALSVFALARLTGAHPPGLGNIAKLMVRNPLILACLAGIALNAGGLGLPPLIGPVVKILGQAALPLGLICVGAGLELETLNRARRILSEATVLRLIGMPLLMAGMCLLFGVSGLTAKVAILMAALPTASSSFILARQLGGDVPLMAGLITATTLAGMVTMPLLLPFLW
jgi:predicted permease